MIAPKNLKLNRFCEMRVPKPAELFSRMGSKVSVPRQGYSGDDVVGTIDSRKTDIDFSLLSDE